MQLLRLAGAHFAEGVARWIFDFGYRPPGILTAAMAPHRAGLYVRASQAMTGAFSLPTQNAPGIFPH